MERINTSSYITGEQMRKMVIRGEPTFPCLLCISHSSSKIYLLGMVVFSPPYFRNRSSMSPSGSPYIEEKSSGSMGIYKISKSASTMIH
jgi:hypothetical protein